MVCNLNCLWELLRKNNFYLINSKLMLWREKCDYQVKFNLRGLLTITATTIRVNTMTITSTDMANPFQLREFAFDPTSSYTIK